MQDLKSKTTKAHWFDEIFHQKVLIEHCSRLRQLFGPLKNFDLTKFFHQNVLKTSTARWSTKNFDLTKFFHQNVLKTLIWLFYIRMCSKLFWLFGFLIDTLIWQNRSSELVGFFDAFAVVEISSNLAIFRLIFLRPKFEFFPWISVELISDKIYSFFYRFGIQFWRLFGKLF